jgi:hypothetical protein
MASTDVTSDACDNVTDSVIVRNSRSQSMAEAFPSVAILIEMATEKKAFELKFAIPTELFCMARNRNDFPKVSFTLDVI